MFFKSRRTYRIANATRGAEYAAAVQSALTARQNQVFNIMRRIRCDVDASRWGKVTRSRMLTDNCPRAEISPD